MKRLEEIHRQLEQLPPNDHVVDLYNLGSVAQCHQVRQLQTGFNLRLVLGIQELLGLNLGLGFIVSKRFLELLIESESVRDVVERLMSLLL